MRPAAPDSLLSRRVRARRQGRPGPYLKTTNFDTHYHDCDEYWVVWGGRGRGGLGGAGYEVGPGDCVATGMGHHHDFARVHEPVRAVYFETTLGGAKRLGHLWEHTHGPARPRRIGSRGHPAS